VSARGRSASSDELLLFFLRHVDAILGPLLFDPVSESASVRADSLVARHDRHELRRFAEQLRCRQVDRVERANRFDGKRPPNPVEHRLTDVENEAAPFERSKGAYRSLFILRGQPTRRSGMDDYSSRF